MGNCTFDKVEDCEEEARLSFRYGSMDASNILNIITHSIAPIDSGGGDPYERGRMSRE